MKFNQVFDNCTKILGNSLGFVHEIKKDIEHKIDHKMQDYFKRNDFVTRKEFNLLKDMVEKQRLEQERLLELLAKHNIKIDLHN